MKATAKLLVAALAAAGLGLATNAAAAGHGGGGMHGGGGGWSGGGGGHWGGGGGGHWGGSSGHWNGGGHGWHGGHGSHCCHSHVSVAFGFPIVWGSWWWGWPYYDYWYYPGYYPYGGYYGYPYAPAYPAAGPGYPAQPQQQYPDGEMSGTEAPRGPGAPQQAPSYMNYCESAKAYYPKVASCPEGWKFIQPSH